MSAATDPKMPAFPRTYNGDGHNGMTLRDYFAAKAMQAIYSSPHSVTFDVVAKDSYRVADAMLAARDAA